MAHKSAKSVVPRMWYLIDAKDQVLGRVATQCANLIRGKKKPNFLPHQDTGDYVVVINAKDVKLTGDKYNQKTYYWHTGWPGGIKEVTVKQLYDRYNLRQPTYKPTHNSKRQGPEDIVRKAVERMLPKNAMQDAYMKKLRIFAEEDHPYEAQVTGFAPPDHMKPENLH
eukprot:GFYU01021214.1.p2 GENE.GFYU01021214.1~~GFYU01021214.1.p2  ORF type:complete len:168 (+),score=46.63 GFYU01021214.1:28-531(+)